MGISVLQMAISAPGCTGTPADEALVKPPPTETREQETNMYEYNFSLTDSEGKKGGLRR